MCRQHFPGQKMQKNSRHFSRITVTKSSIFAKEYLGFTINELCCVWILFCSFRKVTRNGFFCDDFARSFSHGRKVNFIMSWILCQVNLTEVLETKIVWCCCCLLLAVAVSCRCVCCCSCGFCFCFSVIVVGGVVFKSTFY